MLKDLRASSSDFFSPSIIGNTDKEVKEKDYGVVIPNLFSITFGYMLRIAANFMPIFLAKRGALPLCEA